MAFLLGLLAWCAEKAKGLFVGGGIAGVETERERKGKGRKSG